MKNRSILALFLSITVFCTGFTSAVAQAGMVSTRDAMTMEMRQQHISRAQAMLARSEVSQAMVQLGVDPAQARLRVAALSNEELAQLSEQMDSLPAGGILALIGAVFVVLLILEIIGVTNIFNK
ncbi:MAG: PA2779 family protein, partial [Halioglobus sp.]|nr:PA2779 family protein [Halioglobus sp.]